MYSKLLLGLVSVLFLSSCSDFLDGKKSTNQVIEMSNPKLECLKSLPEQLQSFSTGTSNKQAVKDGFECLEYSLGYFRDRTQGTYKEAYSAEDLRLFFGKYFLKDNNISPSLALSLMRLKKALMGGSEEVITKAEISKVIQLLIDLEPEVMALQKHILLLSFQTPRAEVKANDVDLSLKQIRASLQKVLANINIQRSDYSFDEAKLLLSSLSEFVAGPQALNFMDQTESLLPIAQAVKDIMFGSDSVLISEREWRAGLDSLIDLYGLYLRYHYLLAGSSPDDPEKVSLYLTYADDCLKLIENSHQMKRRSMIPFAPINELINLGVQKQFIPGGMTSFSIQKTYQLALRRVFESYQGTDNRGFEYLELRHLSAIRREIKIFQANVKLIEKIGTHDKVKDIQALIDKNQAQAISKTLSQSPFEQEAIVAGMEDFESLLTRRKGLKFNQRGEVIFAYNQDSVSSGWSGLLQLNLVHALSRLMMLGYGERDVLHLSRGKLDTQALQSWYQEFSEIGNETKIFDPRSQDPGMRSAKEANYFTFSGNGDSIIDFYELNEFLGFLIGGGLRFGGNIQEYLDSQKCRVEQTDFAGRKKYSQVCVQNQLREYLMNKPNSLLGLQRYLHKLGIQGWAEYFSSALSIIRSIDAVDGSIELSEVRGLAMILHYSESMFITFDLNQDEKLSIAEIRGAAPRFREVLRPQVPLNNDDLIDDVFVYFVIHGEPPKFWSYTLEKAKELLGMNENQFAERKNILSVLQGMKAMSTK